MLVYTDPDRVYALVQLWACPEGITKAKSKSPEAICMEPDEIYLSTTARAQYSLHAFLFHLIFLD